jgi:hypothetical protein
VGLAAIYWYDRVGQRPDPTFDTSVTSPAYRTAGPRLAFDVGHRNWHLPTDRYRPLAELLRHDGYDVRTIATDFSRAALDSVRVLIVANAMGPDGHEGRPAFTPAEDSVVADWVRAGGSLLLIADHVPFGSAAAPLAASFGVRMYLAFARDDRNSGWDNERLIFSRANGLLSAHPITNGRSASERVTTVVTLTGQSLSIPEGATPLLRMDDQSYDWESRQVRHSAKGHAQGIAMRFGMGKVVILGEAGMLSGQVDALGNKMGMNHSGNDDRQFALNVVHWLSDAAGAR